MCIFIAVLLQIFLQNFYSNVSCFSLGNSQVSVYRTIGPTMVINFCVKIINILKDITLKHEMPYVCYFHCHSYSLLS